MIKYLLSLALLLPFGGANAAGGTEKITVQSGKIRNKFTVEIADDELSREKGLMFRESLDADKGMLFIFRTEQAQDFWMKDTLIPLDMIFIKKGGTIIKVHPNARPHDLTMISSGQPAVAVLELKGGEAARRKIATGDKVISRFIAK